MLSLNRKMIVVAALAGAGAVAGGVWYLQPQAVVFQAVAQSASTDAGTVTAQANGSAAPAAVAPDAPTVLPAAGQAAATLNAPTAAGTPPPSGANSQAAGAPVAPGGVAAGPGAGSPSSSVVPTSAPGNVVQSSGGRPAPQSIRARVAGFVQSMCR